MERRRTPRERNPRGGCAHFGARIFERGHQTLHCLFPPGVLHQKTDGTGRKRFLQGFFKVDGLRGHDP